MREATFISIGALALIMMLSLLTSASGTGCKAPPGISNGKHNGGSKSFYKVGEKITYSCHSGYKLVGSSQLFCLQVYGRQSRSDSSQGRYRYSSDSGDSSSSYSRSSSYSNSNSRSYSNSRSHSNSDSHSDTSRSFSRRRYYWNKSPPRCIRK